MACYQRALQAKPDYAEAHNNLGNVLQEQGQAAEAIACYQRALQLKPDYAEAHDNLGNVLQAQGQTDGGARLLPACPATETGLWPRPTTTWAASGGPRARSPRPRPVSSKRFSSSRPTASSVSCWRQPCRPLYQSTSEVEPGEMNLVENVRLLRQDGVTLDLTRIYAPNSLLPDVPGLQRPRSRSATSLGATGRRPRTPILPCRHTRRHGPQNPDRVHFSVVPATTPSAD